MKERFKKYARKFAWAMLLVSGLFFITSLFYTIYLKWFPPFTTPLMIKRSFEAKDPDKPRPTINCVWMRLSDISNNAKVAVIAEEDQNFANHGGFDFKAIEKAIKHNKKSKTVRGASTISQQVAKNVFLWNGRSWVRKGLEVYFTFLIEHIWGKERILQMYLNIAEMGDGAFGIEAASQKYFHKSASNISPAEAALIAAVLPNPRMYKAAKPTPYIKRKQERIQRAMKKIGGAGYLDHLSGSGRSEK
jgi:monofunctional biosynthetic peptidoglycan transglycosylase